MPRVCVLVIAVLLSGCHRYIPAPLGSVPAGTPVRIDLSEQGARRVEELTGRAARRVDGELERWAEQVVIAAKVPTAEGVLDRDLRRRIIVAEDDVLAVSIRELDRTRTALLTAAVLGGVAAAAISAFSGVFGGSSPEPVDPGVPGEILVPVRLYPFR